MIKIPTLKRGHGSNIVYMLDQIISGHTRLLISEKCHWASITFRENSPPFSRGYTSNDVFSETYPSTVVVENGKSSPEILVVLAISIEENAVVLFQLRQDVLPAPEYDTHTWLLAPSCRTYL